MHRIDPTTLTAAGDFQFRPAGAQTPFSNAQANDMLTVMPGKPGTVAMSFTRMPASRELRSPFSTTARSAQTCWRVASFPAFCSPLTANTFS